MFDIRVEKITDFRLLKSAVDFIFGSDVKLTLTNAERWYGSGHSPIRTQWFAIYSKDTPYSVCMQLRTHDKNGALFLIESGRPDTGSARLKDGTDPDYRKQPRNLFIMCNAQHLIDWSHKRMCMNAELPMRQWFLQLKCLIEEIDPSLAKNLEPMCMYRNGKCTEFKCCGRNREVERV
jgi:hypothetical protein